MLTRRNAARCLMAGGLVTAGIAWSAPPAVTKQDEHAARAVVQAQLDAFAADDASAAFAYATPAIRQRFGTAEHFMALVRSNYPAVYRPASVVYLKPEREGQGLVQGVQMIDADGRQWLAVYRLQRQKGKPWRIDGCELKENRGRSA